MRTATIQDYPRHSERSESEKQFAIAPAVLCTVIAFVATGQKAIQEMIQWFNQNSGFVQCVLTAIYVVATLAILWVMTRANLLAAKSIENSQRLRREQTRPFVVFDLVCRDRFIYAELQNYGEMPAFDIAVTVEPEIKSVGDRKSTLLRHVIGMLAPKRVSADLIDVGHQFHQNNPLQFSAVVSYRDGGGTNYRETFPLDLGYYVQMSALDKKDIGRELEKITGALHNLSCTLAKNE